MSHDVSGNRANLSYGETLKLQIAILEQARGGVSEAIWSSPRLTELFQELLFKFHCSVRASVPLLESALERCKEISDQCSVATALIPYYAEHIEEERGHDEWLLEDMEVLGLDRNEVLARIPSADMASLIGAQYYWIKHAHPVATLGYLAAVEGEPIAVDKLDRIVATTAIPREALTSFYRHAELDINHSADLWRLIDELDLTAWHKELVTQSATLAIQQDALMTKNLVDEFK